MICSKEEGISLLRKWTEESTDLRCVLLQTDETGWQSAPWVVHGKCRVHEVSNKLVVAFTEESAFRVLLSAISSFSFSTPRDVGLSEENESAYESWLTMHLPHNHLLMLAEKT